MNTSIRQSRPKQKASPPTTQFNTGIQTRVNTGFTNAPVNRTPREPQTGIRGNRPVSPASPVGNVDFNMAAKPRARGRETTSMVNQGEAINWNSKKLLKAYEEGKRDFADQDLSGLTLTKCFIPGINCYQSNLNRYLQK